MLGIRLLKIIALVICGGVNIVTAGGPSHPITHKDEDDIEDVIKHEDLSAKIKADILDFVAGEYSYLLKKSSKGETKYLIITKNRMGSNEIHILTQNGGILNEPSGSVPTPIDVFKSFSANKVRELFRQMNDLKSFENMINSINLLNLLGESESLSWAPDNQVLDSYDKIDQDISQLETKMAFYLNIIKNIKQISPHLSPSNQAKLEKLHDKIRTIAQQIS